MFTIDITIVGILLVLLKYFFSTTIVRISIMATAHKIAMMVYSSPQVLNFQGLQGFRSRGVWSLIFIILLFM